MGIIVDTFYAVGAHIPQVKEKEFHGRLEKLFQAGGMMEINRVSMFGIETATLQKVRMREDGMDFYYNYFEDDFWEPSGFDLEENCVWSNDIGWHLRCRFGRCCMSLARSTLMTELAPDTADKGL